MKALFDRDGRSDEFVLDAPHDVAYEGAEKSTTYDIQREMHAQVHAAVTDQGTPCQQGPQPRSAPEQQPDVQCDARVIGRVGAHKTKPASTIRSGFPRWRHKVDSITQLDGMRGAKTLHAGFDDPCGNHIRAGDAQSEEKHPDERPVPCAVGFLPDFPEEQEVQRCPPPYSRNGPHDLIASRPRCIEQPKKREVQVDERFYHGLRSVKGVDFGLVVFFNGLALQFERWGQFPVFNGEHLG